VGLDLGRLRALDQEVTAAAAAIKVLTTLRWPEDVERAFLAAAERGDVRAPGVRIEPPDLSEPRAALEAVRPKLRGDDPALRFLRHTVDDSLAAADMLEGLGTERFSALGLELYGTPHDPVHPGAPTTLEAAHHFLRATDRLQLRTPPAELSAEVAAEWLREQLARIFPGDPPRVELDPNLASMASAGSRRVRLRADARFRGLQLRQLLEHEALVHTATRRSGKAQPVLTALGLSTPRTTATQEGLATLAELLSDTLDLARLRRIALRVVAVQAALDGADFVEVYRIFHDAGQDVEESFHSARRILRGGDAVRAGGVCLGLFPKDVVYVRGLLRVHGFLLAAAREGLRSAPRRLFCGRLTLADAVLLGPRFEDGTIRPPLVVPRWVEDADCLAAHLVFAGLLTRVSLDDLGLDDFRA
jgi:uncharacterized protein (TIGR02421 family)